jgi:Transposase DDE domain
MHVARVRSVHGGREYTSVLLRQSYRVGRAVKHRTLASLTALPPAAIDALERTLRGEVLVPATGDAGLRITRSTPHGHVAAVLGMLRALELPRLLDRRPSRQRDLALALIAARILEPASKLATARGLGATTLSAELGIEGATEDELYGALDWLRARQASVERALARRHLREGSPVLLDVTSTWFEGRCCPLAAHGYSRDHRFDRPQLVFGLVTDPDGCPTAVEAFPGNTADPATLEHQLLALRKRFGLERFTLVGDRGMLTSARIERLRELGGIDWVSALRAPAIRRLAADGLIQLSLFDERDLVEISSPDFPGERLVVCRNPVLAAERARKRDELLTATEADLDRIAAAVAAGRLQDAAAIGIRVGRVKDRHRMAKHFELLIGEGSFSFRRRVDAIAVEAALDGLYVIRTSVGSERLDAPGVVLAYKRLSAVERDFRMLKTADLEVRPIHHWREDRVRGHLFLCLLAAYVRWHLERAWAPLLFRDEAPQRADAVAPPGRSEAALAKDRLHRTPDGLPVHGFRSLLADLGTLTRNQVVMGDADDHGAFELLAEATELQARALALASTAPIAT